MIRKIKGSAVALWHDERGASLLEYSVLIGLITAGAVATILSVGDWVKAKWVSLNAVVTTR